MFPSRISVFLVIIEIYQIKCMFFPQYSVMQASLVQSIVTCNLAISFRTRTQINAAISFPIAIPDRKMYLNVGYQFNYGTPFALSNFIKPPYVQNYLKERQFGDEQITATNASEHKERRAVDVSLADMDITAGELYNTLMDYLARFYFDSKNVLRKCQKVTSAFFQC